MKVLRTTTESMPPCGCVIQWRTLNMGNVGTDGWGTKAKWYKGRVVLALNAALFPHSFPIYEGATSLCLRSYPRSGAGVWREKHDRPALTSRGGRADFGGCDTSALSAQVEVT